MKLFNIKDFKGGWIVGNFIPAIIDTTDFEVAFKEYKSGDYDKKHYHKVATEITIISNGSVKMNGKIYEKGQIILIEKGDITDFLALTYCSTIVIKIPSVKDDKIEV